MTVRYESKQNPLQPQVVRELAVDTWRRAESMGLVDPPAGSLTTADLEQLFGRVRDAGIARGSAIQFDNIEPLTARDAERMLRLLLAALEASPVPEFEWPAVARTLDVDQLASLLNISASSLRRYLSGERETPDDVSARLHHLALIVGDLAGAYNDVGVRRWFGRSRAALDGRSPADILSGEWNPDDPGPQKVRELARALVTLSAT